MKEFNKMTDEEIEYFLNKVDEHNARKQREYEKKKARREGMLYLAAAIIAIVCTTLGRMLT